MPCLVYISVLYDADCEHGIASELCPGTPPLLDWNNIGPDRRPTQLNNTIASYSQHFTFALSEESDNVSSIDL